VQSDLGVFLNSNKTEIIWLSGVPHDSYPFAGLNFKCSNVDSLEMLGAPIGSRQWCNDYVLKKAIEKNRAVVDKLDLLNDSQIAFLILRACLSYSKMVYFMRTIPHGQMSIATKEFDAMMLDCLSLLIPYKISPPALQQLQLSISNGGLGIRNTTTHHSASFYSSISSCLPTIRSITKSTAINSVRLQVIARVDMSSYISEADIVANHSQAAYSALVDKNRALELYNNANQTDKARLLASKRPHSSDFLFAPPIAGLGLKLSSAEWNTAVAYKLGLNFNTVTYKCTSNGCDQTMDLQALHSLRCGTAGDRQTPQQPQAIFFQTMPISSTRTCDGTS
ncbi:MAG TPA: hypothetical protein VER35_00615, partial [Candidatus Limnocylindrales bacterium]|nr:hypothetical protein [Candidatus Limnocylindrales bacterium]